MIPIDTIRNEPDKIKENLEKRGLDFPLDELRELDKKWRKKKKKLNQLRHEKNEAEEKIREKKKEGKKAKKQIKQMKKKKKKLEKLEKETEELETERKELWMNLPNLLDEDVPEGEDESDNEELRKEGEPPEFSFEPKTHLELGEELDLMDRKASEVAGEGFYYLKKDLAQLDYALQMYTVDKLLDKDYSLIEPPLMMREEIYKEATNVDKFKEDMYGVKDTDKYLIGTSEHPIVAMHRGDVFSKDELPKKYIGISPCFRKEAGTHGKYRKGLYRMHQFNKIEMVIFCKPEKSSKYLSELQQNTEEIYQDLNLPYRVVKACGGDTSKTQAKTLDTELWMADGEYREAGSNSKTKAYQSRRLNIKYEKEKYGEREYVHTLNSTAVATSRTMLSLMETHQTQDGEIRIPKVLQPYMNCKEKIKKD